MTTTGPGAAAIAGAAGVAPADALAFRPHPEVWLLVGAVVVLWWWSVTRLGRRAAPAGAAPVSRRQLAAFAGAVVVLWVASDWPLHDLGDRYLFSVHMVQHLLLALVLPPLALLATPTWLARLVVGDGRGYAMLRRVTHPVVASVVFNGVIALIHWPAFVNLSLESGAVHYAMHVLVVVSGFVMWLPVAGPLPELQLGTVAKMPYLFVQSILPTVPAAWLTFAEGAVYTGYAEVPRLWGLSVTDDQQIAGFLMKIVAGFYLWSIIAALFFRWALAHERAAEAARRARPHPEIGARPDPHPLTFEEVTEAFERAGPAPPEEG